MLLGSFSGIVLLEMNQQNENKSDDSLHRRITREVRFHVLGWLLFVVCALIFIAAGLRDGDILILTGSIVFLLACFAFLVPLLFPGDK